MVLFGQLSNAISKCRFLFSSELVGGAPRADDLNGKVFQSLLAYHWDIVYNPLLQPMYAGRAWMYMWLVEVLASPTSSTLQTNYAGHKQNY